MSDIQIAISPSVMVSDSDIQLIVFVAFLAVILMLVVIKPK